ncbi:hypothetical protein Cpir12675_001716 [Ceratocystis pirilliformis]|uniref:Uncharacterized protein n=1 Tax=Ceratocystis pirilliformis TaxID=259994 RepID=A0ABR3ZGP6_9PEZI
MSSPMIFEPAEQAITKHLMSSSPPVPRTKRYIRNIEQDTSPDADIEAERLWEYMIHIALDHINQAAVPEPRWTLAGEDEWNPPDTPSRPPKAAQQATVPTSISKDDIEMPDVPRGLDASCHVTAVDATEPTPPRPPVPSINAPARWKPQPRKAERNNNQAPPAARRLTKWRCARTWRPPTQRMSYFLSVQTTKRKYFNDFLEQATGPDIYTALRYTKPGQQNIIPTMTHKGAAQTTYTVK